MAFTENRQRTPEADILLVTLPHVGMAQRPLGLVCGASATTQHLAWNRRAAINELRKQAYDLGADAVVDVRVEVALAGSGPISLVMVSGTAVLLPWPDGHDDPARQLEPPPTCDPPRA